MSRIAVKEVNGRRFKVICALNEYLDASFPITLLKFRTRKRR